MACYKPIKAWRMPSGEILFHNLGDGRPLDIPCGQCIGCRLQRSSDWAMRCVHEASQHNDNCFITLTYNPENLPPDCGLRLRDFQLFMKRLRAYAKDKRIRFYHAGEYGDNTNRPHYHAILFGFNFDDWMYLFDSPSGEPIYTSPTLEKIWDKGFVTIGKVTFESAAYVARYCVKKINGRKADIIDETTGLKHYERINSFTGEITEVMPEYSTMSRRPGIAHNWITRYTRDVYPKDFTTIKNVRMRPSRYYDKYIRSIDPDLYDDIKSGRAASGYMSDDNSIERLAAREKVKQAQFNQLKRSL